MPHFIVISEQGPNWQPNVAMREQLEWSAHAAFMNQLAESGFVVLGGPIADGLRHRARLIVLADDEASVRTRLADDPWARAGLLSLSSIEQWEILLSSSPDS